MGDKASASVRQMGNKRETKEVGDRWKTRWRQMGDKCKTSGKQLGNKSGIMQPRYQQVGDKWVVSKTFRCPSSTS